MYVETWRGFLKVSGEDARVCFADAAGREPSVFAVAGAELAVYQARLGKGDLSRVVDGTRIWSVRVGEYDLT